MKREVPLLISTLTAVLAVTAFFVPHRPFGGMESTLLRWFSIVSGFAMVVGIQSLLLSHFRKLRTPNAPYSLILILGFTLTLIAGIYSIARYGDAFKLDSPFMFDYNYILVPLNSTMFSLLAFFIASAAYRAFRARTLDATLLLFAATAVMLGRVPLGETLWKGFPDLAEWILGVPGMAAQRGILIGITLGAVGMALRVILGIERPYLR